MVSFQCHGCGDVVKKPKLDQHRGRCHTGFDCIDCHTTFNGPAEYKGHTSCISEAEKYQKGLYKGPKTAEPAPRNNYPPLPAAEPRPASSDWGRGYGGGRQSFGGYRNNATGANDTPLGTPKRLSPLPPSPAQEPLRSSKVDVLAPDLAVETTATEKKNKKKRDLAVVNETQASDDTSRPKKVKGVRETPPADPASVPLPPSLPTTPAHTHDGESRQKRQKEKKREKAVAAQAEELKDEKVKRRKSKKGLDDVATTAGETTTPEAPNEGKKSKKSKKETRVDANEDLGDSAVVDESSRAETANEGKKKKSKKEGAEDKHDGTKKRKRRELNGVNGGDNVEKKKKSRKVDDDIVGDRSLNGGKERKRDKKDKKSKKSA